MHSSNDPNVNPNKIANDAMAEVFLAPPKGTTFITNFGHLFGGYDAGYYGYAWSDAISAELASRFEKTGDGILGHILKRGFLNKKVGRSLRDEIYAQGDARDVSDSVSAFMGTPERDLKPFLDKLGIKSNR